MDASLDAPAVPSQLREAYAKWTWTVAWHYHHGAITYRLESPAGEVSFLKMGSANTYPSLNDEAARMRFRDLLDIVLLSTIVDPSPELREVCEETFAIRKRHAWPPQVVTYPPWLEVLEERAGEMGLDHASSEAIVSHVGEYVLAISIA